MQQSIKTFTAGRSIPLAQLGTVQRRLVVLPGINDALRPIVHQDKFMRWFAAPYLSDWSVLFMSRPVGLDAGSTILDMAHQAATAIEELGHPVDLIGISMGGAIAQEIAINHPQLINKLVLGVTAPCMAPTSRPIYERLRALASRSAWRDLLLYLMEITYGGTRRAVMDAMLSRNDPVIRDGPVNPSDFVVSVDACTTHDTRGRLNSIATPTLILAAEDDRLMSLEGTRALHDGIRRSTLHLFENGGHGVLELKKKQWDAKTRQFLE